ncbi:hypothetical protein CRG98_037804 [Punica granatum]|uniref:RNase H type-1 domain-containing protein n=1 Tax=Punica granatum TaxID=22663 RepID=A0A2I0ICU2_PUNGR|nr:hypothetical protein CRG98_037804 [Punica granatum]
MNVLWNGNLTKEFKSGRGIKQGCPLSLYLSVLCVERLSHLIKESVEAEVWQPMRVGRKGPWISHLMFADDISLFVKASENQIATVCAILDRFCAVSWEKRKIHLVNWRTIMQPLARGGLGLRDLNLFNDALLAKLGWRVIMNPSALWVRVLKELRPKDHLVRIEEKIVSIGRWKLRADSKPHRPTSSWQKKIGMRKIPCGSSYGDGTGWVKVNTDGSSRGNSGLAGAGGVIRGEDGQWIEGFAHNVGFATSVIAELWGALIGLQYAWDLGLWRIVLEVDSEVVKLMITRPSPTAASTKLLVEDIRELLIRDWQVQICHPYREDNACADWMGRLVTRLSPGSHFYAHPPSGDLPLLLGDLSGASLPRLCFM